jgi:hypothetical protein
MHFLFRNVQKRSFTSTAFCLQLEYDKSTKTKGYLELNRKFQFVICDADDGLNFRGEKINAIKEEKKKLN